MFCIYTELANFGLLCFNIFLHDLRRVCLVLNCLLNVNRSAGSDEIVDSSTSVILESDQNATSETPKSPDQIASSSDQLASSLTPDDIIAVGSSVVDNPPESNLADIPSDNPVIQSTLTDDSPLMATDPSKVADNPPDSSTDNSSSDVLIPIVSDTEPSGVVAVATEVTIAEEVKNEPISNSTESDTAVYETSAFESAEDVSPLIQTAPADSNTTETDVPADEVMVGQNVLREISTNQPATELLNVPITESVAGEETSQSLVATEETSQSLLAGEESSPTLVAADQPVISDTVEVAVLESDNSIISAPESVFATEQSSTQQPSVTIESSTVVLDVQIASPQLKEEDLPEVERTAQSLREKAQADLRDKAQADLQAIKQAQEAALIQKAESLRMRKLAKEESQRLETEATRARELEKEDTRRVEMEGLRLREVAKQDASRIQKERVIATERLALLQKEQDNLALSHYRGVCVGHGLDDDLEDVVAMVVPERTHSVGCQTILRGRHLQPSVLATAAMISECDLELRVFIHNPLS